VVGRVVRFTGIQRRIGVELGLVGGHEGRVLGCGQGIGGGRGEIGALGPRRSRPVDEADVERSVTGDEGGGDAGVLQLQGEGAGFLVVAAVDDGIDAGLLDGIHRGRIVVALVDRAGRGDADARIGELLAHDVGQTLAVLGGVIDHCDLLGLHGRGEEAGDRRSLGVVVGDGAVEHLPVVVGQGRVGRRGGDGGQATGVEDRVSLLGFAREGGTDDGDQVGVADRVLGQAGRLGRVTLAVERLVADLAARMSGVELIERQLHPVGFVDAELR
jgi:hypothetical protein